MDDTCYILSLVRIILVKPQEPGNIGSAARVMKNFGLSDLYLVAPQCELTKEAFYMSTHAVDVVENAKIVSTVQEAVSDRTFVIGTTAQSVPLALLTFIRLEKQPSNFPVKAWRLCLDLNAQDLAMKT